MLRPLQGTGGGGVGWEGLRPARAKRGWYRVLEPPITWGRDPGGVDRPPREGLATRRLGVQVPGAVGAGVRG